MKFLSIPTALALASVAILELFQTEPDFSLVEEFLSTEKVLSYILIYFTIYAFPVKIWPFITKQMEEKAKRDYEYRMAELKVREAAEEQQMVLLMKLADVGVEVRDIVAGMSTAVQGFLSEAIQVNAKK